jgi:hypothetical protein
MNTLLQRLDNYFGITDFTFEPFPNSDDEKIIRGLGWALFGLVIVEVALCAVLIGGFITEVLV